MIITYEDTPIATLRKLVAEASTGQKVGLTGPRDGKKEHVTAVAGSLEESTEVVASVQR